jgi:hypothetical protein
MSDAINRVRDRRQWSASREIARMTSRILMAAALATALATGLAAGPAFAQPAPTPATPTPTQGSQRPGATPGAHPGPTVSGQPTPMPQLTFEEIVGDIPVGQTVSPTALGVGAIAGVIVLNLVAPSLWPATYLTGGPLVGTIFADSALAASRVYTVTSAVVGAWAGQWVYSNWLAR